MKPLIGVPTDPFCHEYADIALAEMDEEKLNFCWLLERLTEKICSSVRNAGGVPLLLSSTDDENEMESLAKRLDGFVFAGGDDIAPSFYGETYKGSVSPNYARDRFEIGLLKKIIKEEKPVLGICRGAQIINVALGGTLYQHLPDVNPEWTLHKRPDVMEGCVHDVEFMGETIPVNSMHHQAIDKLAPGLEATAKTEDGLVEGVALNGYRHLVGVQWHPECLTAKDPLAARLFSELVNASAAQR